MAIHIVESACQFTPDLGRGKIVVESDDRDFQKAFFELTEGIDARNLAVAFAARLGMASPRVNGNIQGPYPINRAGIPLEEVRGPDGQGLPQQHEQMQPARYRIDVPVCRPLM